MLRRITLVAHRGYSSHAPENTLAAFEMALARGYRDIEFDVQLTKDGIPVVLHDVTLDRTTNGSGVLADFEYSELQSLDAGTWFSPKFSDQRIPTLKDVLERLSGRARLHIELKLGQPELPVKVADLLEATGWLSDCKQGSVLRRLQKTGIIVSSQDRDMLVSSIELLPTFVKHELIVEKATDESLEWAASHGLYSVHPANSEITPSLIKKARKLKLHIGVWWWSREEQDIAQIRGARFAFVDEPDQHRWRSKVSYVWRNYEERS